MSDIIACLTLYKTEIIDLSANYNQEKFIRTAFTRWYLNSKKDKIQGIFPLQNIINNDAIKDLEYANNKKNLNFNIKEFIDESKKLFVKYKTLCKESHDTPNTYPKDAITKNQLSRLKKLYTGNKKEQDAKINTLVNLYVFVGINTLHLGIPPIFKGVELFGSPLNTHNKEYCSPFLIEKDFGSLGSFWDYHFHKSDIYLCNPPFDDVLIINMANKLIQDLQKTKYQVIVVITIPVWDSKTQQKYNLQDYKTPYKGYDILMKSKFKKDHEVLDKELYPYWNYYEEEKAPASWTHLITLSNVPKSQFDIKTFMKKWKDF